MFTREQVKAARTVRGWGVRDLHAATQTMFGAKEAVSVSAITRFENGADSRGDTLRKLQLCLEAEGFDFLNSGRPGIRWDADAPTRWSRSSGEKQNAE